MLFYRSLLLLRFLSAFPILVHFCQRPDNSYSFSQDLYRFCHKCLNIPQFSLICLITTECPRLLQFFVLFSCPIMRTVFHLQFILNCSSSTPQAVLQFGLVFVTDFTSYSVFSVSQIHEVRTGSSPRTSQGRSGPTSLNLSVFIFWGLSH